MDVWTNNFLWIVIVCAALGWWITGLYWRSRIAFLLRLPLTIGATFCTMTIVGALGSLIAHMASTSFKQILSAIFEDPIGAIFYFSETGWETGVLWIPAMVLRIVVLEFHSFRKPQLPS